MASREMHSRTQSGLPFNGLHPRNPCN